jgi:hypothetical protein
MEEVMDKAMMDHIRWKLDEGKPLNYGESLELQDLLHKLANPLPQNIVRVTEVPIVVDFESDALKYKTDIVKALHDAGAPFCHEDGRLMSAVEQIEWLGKRVGK